MKGFGAIFFVLSYEYYINAVDREIGEKKIAFYVKKKAIVWIGIVEQQYNTELCVCVCADESEFLSGLNCSFWMVSFFCF